uniref:MazG-like pyrophosphatase n=2 Tax=unclassified bacterial viruses TaxID=12333 RepID=A0AAU8KU32_9VIRU
MEQLIKQIEQWASDRNIIKGSKPIDQAMKLFSEFGELADNVGKGRDCRDDIGDCGVVLIIMCAQVGFDFNDCMDVDFCEGISTKQKIIELMSSLSAFAYNCDQHKDVRSGLFESVSALKLVCNDLGYKFDECLQIAYDDIKHRKGIMVNGVFIKESDPVYAQVISEIEGNYNA